MSQRIHFNKPQLKSMLVGAPVEYLIAGRGTGKSEGVLAPKTANCYLGTMPRSAGVALGATYNQLLTRTLPALIAGWEKIGYINEKHFIIGKKPPEKWVKAWNWRGPYRPPLDYKYFISWWNGAGAHLVSQDRAGSSNGLTIDWLFGDELKLINYEKLKTELLPANRGRIPAFNGNPYHHGMTFTTDMPVGTAGRWIFEMESKMDKNTVNQILAIQKAIYQLKIKSANSYKPVQHEIKKQIAVLNDEINSLREGLLFYHEASTLENIHALGSDYIKQQLRDTTEFQFDTQILNIRPMKMEDGFYPDFDEEEHGYFAADNNYLERINYDMLSIKSINCLRDSDRSDDMPLHIALDYNRRIHPMVIGQVHGNDIKIIKSMHSLYPDKLKEVLDQFIEYYRPHKRKTVIYWYDHTAVADDNATRKCDEVISTLRKAGWVVIGLYLGQAASHEARYRMFGHLFKEDGYYKKKIRFNRENAERLITAVNKAEAEQGKDGFGKNKKSEKDPNFPADESTHYTDALDTLVYGVVESNLKYHSESKGSSVLFG